MNSIPEHLNPFIPTQRDLERSEELSRKNVIIAGILTFIFLPAGLFYLNRAINPLKIFGFTFALALLVALVTPRSEENEGSSPSDLILLLGLAGCTTEQIMTINKARQRKSQGISIVNTLNPNLQDIRQETPSHLQFDDHSVNALKVLKQKFENNEISEEEFKLEKQKVLDSL